MYSELDGRFLLDDALAGDIFAACHGLPVVDYHCHLDAGVIAADRNPANLTRLWLSDDGVGDHYKWRLLRADGVPEDLITGTGDDYAKFEAFAATMEKAAGNPVYDWSHLELRRYFDIDLPLTRANAPAIWAAANARLAGPDFTPRALLIRSRVEVAVTTDDPLDDLAAHRALSAWTGSAVLPGWRPDRLLDFGAPDYPDYLAKLGGLAGVEITSFAALLEATARRMDYFTAAGCRVADHGLDSFAFQPADAAELDRLLARRLAGEPPDAAGLAAWRTGLLTALLGLEREAGWAAQIHYGAARRLNDVMTPRLGPDTGFDSIGFDPALTGAVARLIRATHAAGRLPKLIVYPLNPADWPVMATLIGDFQGEGRQRLQLGAAWWFNDHRAGIDSQLELFAAQSLIGNFTGMLTDSRSLLSYPRHEYFRRILASRLSSWHRQGRFAGGVEQLITLAQNISYHNAKAWFGF